MVGGLSVPLLGVLQNLQTKGDCRGHRQEGQGYKLRSPTFPTRTTLGCMEQTRHPQNTMPPNGISGGPKSPYLPLQDVAPQLIELVQGQAAAMLGVSIWLRFESPRQWQNPLYSAPMGRTPPPGCPHGIPQNSAAVIHRSWGRSPAEFRGCAPWLRTKPKTKNQTQQHSSRWGPLEPPPARVQDEEWGLALVPSSPGSRAMFSKSWS